MDGLLVFVQQSAEPSMVVLNVRDADASLQRLLYLRRQLDEVLDQQAETV